jgi:hypothetical protein
VTKQSRKPPALPAAFFIPESVTSHRSHSHDMPHGVFIDLMARSLRSLRFTSVAKHPASAVLLNSLEAEGGILIAGSKADRREPYRQ